MVYAKGETTSFNPFWSEENSTDYALGFPPFDETIPLPLSASLPVASGGGGGGGGRSRTGTRRGGNSHSHVAVVTPTNTNTTTSSSWHDDFQWRMTEDAATADLSWRVDTPTIASSRSSYHPTLPPSMVDPSLESHEDNYHNNHYEEYGDADHDHDRVNSRSFFPKGTISPSMDRSNLTLNNTPTTPSISVLLQERLSISFDGLSPEPSCQVIGRIYIQSPSSKPNSLTTTRNTTTNSSSTTTTTTLPSNYHLIVHDRKRWVEQWTIQSSESCKEDVEAFTSFRHMSLQSTDRLFRIDTSKIQPRPEPTAILEYQCSTKLKPIPMLIKTKLQRTEKGKSHLGIRLRANPANRSELEQLAILVVVPPHVQPEDPPPQGGTWDDVKRTLSWGCDTLHPGQGMNLQITFHGIMDTNDHDTCPFPILVHCRGYRSFSRLNISGETMDGRPLNVDVQRTTTVLYRKL